MRRRASFAEWLEGFKLRLSVEKRRLTSKQLLVAQAGDGWKMDTWIFQVCKICAFYPKKNLPKRRNFTHPEDPGMIYGWFGSIFFWLFLDLDG